MNETTGQHGPARTHARQQATRAPTRTTRLGEASHTEHCSACGDRVVDADVMYTEAGGLCVSCFTVQQAHAAVARPWAGLGRTGLASALLLAFGGGLAAFLVFVGPPGGMYGVAAWVSTTLVAGAFALATAMTGARFVRDGAVDSMQVAQSAAWRWANTAVAAIATTGAGLATVLLWGLSTVALW